MTLRAPIFFLAVVMAALPAGAQDAQPAPPGPTRAVTQTTPSAGMPGRDAENIVLAPRPNVYVPQPPTDSDGVNRSVSPDIAAALALGMPKYSHPTPTPTPLAEPRDLREVDKPKNDIKRLPSYVVRESRPPVFRDRDLYTKGGLVNLSFQNHPGLAYGNILGVNSRPAYEMYLDDQRQANMADLGDTARAISRGGDPAEGRYILQQSRDSYMRSDDDWSRLNDPWNFSGHGGNFGGAGR